MTLEEILIYDFTGLNILIIGRPSAGKTWLSKVLEPMYKHHQVLHTDDYLEIHPHESGQIQAIIEDATYDSPTIIEGMSSYKLLLTGAQDKSYSPDIVIEVSISAGKQREIYLSERDPAKIKHLKRFEFAHLETMNEYHRIVPAEQKPQFITFNNEWTHATKVKDK